MSNTLLPIPMTRATTRETLGPAGVNVEWAVNEPSQEWNSDGSWRGCFINTGDNYQVAFIWGASNEAGTIQCEFEAVASGVAGTIWELSDSGGTHRIRLYRHTNNQLRLDWVSAGQTFTNVVGDFGAFSGKQNVVVSWRYVAVSQTEQTWNTSTEVWSTSTYRWGTVTPEIKVWRNGATVTVTENPVASIPKGMTILYTGQDRALGTKLNGWLRSMTPYRTRQDDSISIQLSEVI